MENLIKGAIAAVFAWICSLMGMLAPWIAMIITAMVLDYITGMAAAWNAGQLNSRLGMRGILKKLGYLVIISVAMITDWVVAAGGVYLGFTVKTPGYFALLVIIWLLINELISVLENAAKLGVPYPEWLLKLLAHLKQSTDKKGDVSGV